VIRCDIEVKLIKDRFVPMGNCPDLFYEQFQTGNLSAVRFLQPKFTIIKKQKFDMTRPITLAADNGVIAPEELCKSSAGLGLMVWN
jgi:hypothetical protein